MKTWPPLPPPICRPLSHTQRRHTLQRVLIKQDTELSDRAQHPTHAVLSDGRGPGFYEPLIGSRPLCSATTELFGHPKAAAAVMVSFFSR